MKTFTPPPSGVPAESLVCEFLVTRGYTILKRNLLTPFGEIDILAKDKNEYVCIEVRSRQEPDSIPPELAFTRKKYRHLVRSLLSIEWLHNKPLRIDFVSVMAGKIVAHYQDIRGALVAPKRKLQFG